MKLLLTIILIFYFVINFKFAVEFMLFSLKMDKTLTLTDLIIKFSYMLLFGVFLWLIASMS